MNTKAQGDIGVAMAIAYYTSMGRAVSIPLGDNTRYDLVVDFDGKLLKIQCKTSGLKEKGNYKVTLKTSGGNKSGSSVKLISELDADLVFVYTMDGGWWELPQAEFLNKVSVTLGPTRQKFRLN